MKYLNRTLTITIILSLAFMLFSCEEEPNEDSELPIFKEQVHEECVDGTVCISNDYVSIDWDNKSNKVLSANTQTGDFIIQLADKKQIKELKEGSLLTMDVDSAIYLRRVKTVTQEGNTISVETEQGSMAELFAGSEFVLTFGEIPDTAVFVNSKGQRMRPIQATYTRIRNEDGTHCDVPNHLLTRTYYNSKDSWTIGPEIEIPDQTLYDKPPMKLEFGGNFKFQFTAGYAILCNFSSYGEYLDEASDCNAYIGLTVYWKQDFDVRANLKGTSSLSLKGKAKKGKDGKISDGRTYFKEMGNDDVNEKLAQFFEKTKVDAKETKDIWEISLDANISDPLKPEGKEESSETKTVKMTADMKGMFEPKIELFAGAEFNGGLHFTLTNTTPNVLSLQIAQHGHFMPTISVPTCDVKHANTHIEPYISVGGRITVSLGARAGFIFSLFDYNLVSAGIEGVLFDGETQGGVLGTIANVETDYGLVPVPTGAIVATQKFKTPSISAFAGVNPALLAKLPFYGDELKEWVEEHAQISTGNILPSYEYEAPTEVRFKTKSSELQAHAKNQVIIEVLGEENGETKGCDMATQVIVIAHGGGQFEYYNKNLLGVEDGTHDWHVAHCITVCHYESVWWQPKTINDCLEIRLYKYDGSYQQKFLYLTDEGAGHESVDMGGDVYWASENVVLGNKKLFGWGDGTGQHIEQCWRDYYSYDEDGEPYGDKDPTYEEDEYKVFGYYSGTEPYSQISGSSDDIATRVWGGGWRMPKKKEWEWLIKNCTWEWSDDPKGYWVRSAVGVIFLPADGAKMGNTYDTVETCEYWTSDGLTGDNYYLDEKGRYIYSMAYYLSAMPKRKNGVDIQITDTYKLYQQSVRPVRDK